MGEDNVKSWIARSELREICYIFLTPCDGLTAGSSDCIFWFESAIVAK